MFGFKSVAVAALLTLAAILSATAAETATRKSSAAGVTITVTPDLASSRSWGFKVVLDTHTQDLNDDLMATAALVDAAGTRHAPIAWEGAAPGGHHREGILRFAAINPPPAFIELEVRRASESAPRTFRWQLQ